MPRRQNNKRRRNKSSPGNIKINKKYRVASGSDSGEDSEYIEPLDYSDTETDITKIQDISTISQADIEMLADRIAPVLVTRLRNELIKEVQSLIKAESLKMNEEIKHLKESNVKLANDLDETKRELDDLQQYGRRMNLDVSGIPGDTGDNTENVKKKVLKQAVEHNIVLNSNDIDKCHRKGQPKVNHNRIVIIKFSNSEARDRIYKLIKSFGDGIFIQENLTPLREKLAYEARQLVRCNKLDKTWIAGCKIKAQLPKKLASFVIRDMNDIKCLLEGNPLPAY